jgi:hypothetical protein
MAIGCFFRQAMVAPHELKGSVQMRLMEEATN